MGTKRKSLAQELAELYNPAPTVENDPDALDLADGAKLASDDEYAETQRKPSRHAPEKPRLLRGDILLEDAAYRGRKTSRATVFDDEAAAEDSDDDADDGDADDSDLGTEEEDDGEEEDDEGVDDTAHRRAAGKGAGPSGRSLANGTGAGHRAAKAAPLANGHMDGSDVSDDGSDTEDEEDEEEDVDLDGDADGDMLLSGSGSELDEEEEDGEGEEDGAGRTRSSARGDPTAGVAAAASGAAGSTRRTRPLQGAGGELEQLEAEYEALQEEDDQHLSSLRQKGERDRTKGRAVRHQQVLYERALEQRILLQRCLQASNGLPRPDTHAALVRTQPDVREGFTKLAAAARDTLAQMLELQHTLMARNTAIVLPPQGQVAVTANGVANADQPPVSDAREGSGPAPSKRRREDAYAGTNGGGSHDALEALWRRISSYHEALAPFRDVSLDSWHRRTVLSSGGGALRNGGLRALNQSISSQVQALMRDPAKFINRTRLTLAACPRVLCEPQRKIAVTAVEPVDADGEPGPAAADPDKSGPFSSVAADVVEEERDGETYEDSEFYQQLLKEFLDKGLAEGAAAGAPKAAKKRKLVDRRASKGRKLRYHVQDKLVAFMAPVDFELPPFAANLFSNLFGHAGN